MKKARFKRKFNVGDKVILNGRAYEPGIIKNKIYTIREVHSIFPLIRLYEIGDNWFRHYDFDNNQKLRNIKLNKLFSKK